MTHAASPTERYVGQFKVFSENGASGAPAWLSRIRSQAIEEFSRAGFPTTRDERWRFTNVGRLSDTPYELASSAARVARPDVEQHILPSAADQCLVFINGVYSEGLSSVRGLPPQVVLGNLAGIAREHPDLIERHLAKYAKLDDNPFTALGSAFITDGGMLHVPSNMSIEQPIQLLYLTVPAGEPLVAHPRNLVVVEQGASAVLVESHIGLADGPLWTNTVAEVVVGSNARLQHYRIQHESQQAYHTATTQSYQRRDSVYGLTTVEIGAALSRHDINAVLDGSGAACSLYGLSQLQGRQHVDHHTTIDHAQPHCNSWEYFNGIYGDRSRGVFTGRIIVRPGAQRTDSKQTNNNLLLSEQARADSQPQLEIYADDVKCTHGATLGPIDERAVFYLQSRGIPADAARNLLTHGFAQEILGLIELTDLRERLDRELHARLDEGAARVGGA